MTQVSNERLAEMLGAWEADERRARLGHGMNLHEMEIVSALRELLSLRQSHSTGAVKGLEWWAVEPNWWVAQPSVMIGGSGYEVRITDSGKVRARRGSEDWFQFDGTADEAKAHWQANYESRILSALYPHPKEAKVTDSDLLAAMKEHVGWELDWGPEDRHDEESDFGWRVFERSGGRSDLEWTLLGFGETPRAALVAALSRKG